MFAREFAAWVRTAPRLPEGSCTINVVQIHARGAAEAVLTFRLSLSYDVCKRNTKTRDTKHAIKPVSASP